MSNLNDTLNANRERQNHPSPVTVHPSPAEGPLRSSQVASNAVQSALRSSQVASNAEGFAVQSVEPAKTSYPQKGELVPERGYFDTQGKWVARQANLSLPLDEEQRQKNIANMDAVTKRAVDELLAEEREESRLRLAGSGFHGVYLQNGAKSKTTYWRAQVCVKGWRYHLGTYETAEHAAHIVDNAKFYLWQAGFFKTIPRLNFDADYVEGVPRPLFTVVHKLIMKLKCQHPEV